MFVPAKESNTGAGVFKKEIMESALKTLEIIEEEIFDMRVQIRDMMQEFQKKYGWCKFEVKVKNIPKVNIYDQEIVVDIKMIVK